jgi:hypothetical protein
MPEGTQKRSAAQWKPRPIDLTLPSGMVVKVRRPPITLWVAQKRVPERLFNNALRVTANGAPRDIDGDAFAELMGFALEVARAALVWPKCVDDPDPEAEDEVSAGDIPPRDLIVLAGWAVGSVSVETESGEVSADALDSFRGEPGVSGSGDDGGKVPPEAERDAGDS